MRSQSWITRLRAISFLKGRATLRSMFKTKALFYAFLSVAAIVVTSGLVFPVQAQLPNLQDLNLPSPSLLNQNQSDRVDSACVRLDQRCVFNISDRRSDLPARIEGIEQRLENVRRTYLRNESAELKIYSQQEQNLPNIYVAVGNQEPVRLLSVTSQDADLEGVDLETRTEQIINQLEQGLERAKQERKPEFLTRQVGIAIGIGVAMLVASLAIYYWEGRLKRSKDELTHSDSSPTQPISTQLTQKQEWNVKEVQHRLFQLAKVGILGGGTLLILGLFPQTRVLQVLIIRSLKIPLRLGLIGAGTYLVIRLSYALIDKFTSALARNALITPEANRRLQLRLSTISGVTKGIVTITWISISILVMLAMIGVNLAPVLAGAGIIGVGLSLASQSLIKDALNGFFIILEDQYAVGDVINVGDVGGLVETMNLRITQLRDAEGRLITVPNSEIKIVANLSSNWSRADLAIPIAYYAEVDKALELINQVAQNMTQEPQWRERIVDKPEVLGVDDFGNRGVIIRVWIKTQPLKQWDVAREFRRRLKVALDQAGIAIPMPQQEIWFSNAVPVKSTEDSRTASHS